MDRKIMQICTVPFSDPYTEHPMIHALCDDGTVWEFWQEKVWRKLPAIPQDAPPEPDNAPAPAPKFIKPMFKPFRESGR